MSDNTVFPEIYGLKNKTFLEVYNTKKEWVDFTLTEMQKPSGLFKTWRDYCLNKNKVENGFGPKQTRT